MSCVCVCLCVTLVYCSQISKQIELIIGVTITAEDSHFVPDADLNTTTEKDTSTPESQSSGVGCIKLSTLGTDGWPCHQRLSSRTSSKLYESDY